MISSLSILISCQQEVQNEEFSNPVREEVVQVELSKAGGFDGGLTPEISGLAFSKTYQNRAYVHNDSGDKPRFFVATATGAKMSEVKISGADHTDYEDLAIGPCEVGQCLFIGDIGDNRESRSNIRVIIIQEEETFSKSVAPIKTLNLKYGDGSAHNCESLTVHPVTGDLFLFTKTDNKPKLFKVSAKEIEESESGQTLTIKEMGVISISSLFKNGVNLATAMDISPDGGSFVILTYTDAYEFEFDLSANDLVDTKILGEVNRIQYKLKVLPQQEAIAYGVSDGKLYYTTEVSDDVEAPLMSFQIP